MNFSSSSYINHINQSTLVITTSAVQFKTIPRVGGRRGNPCSLCDSQPIIREDITEHTDQSVTPGPYFW